MVMLRRERKEQKRQRLAMKRYVALRMEEDIEASIKAITRKARNARNAANAQKKRQQQGLNTGT